MGKRRRGKGANGKAMEGAIGEPSSPASPQRGAVEVAGCAPDLPPDPSRPIARVRFEVVVDLGCRAVDALGDPPVTPRFGGMRTGALFDHTRRSWGTVVFEPIADDAAPEASGVQKNMISISQGQWDRLGKSDFESRMIGVLREQFPEQTAGFSDDQLAAPMPALVTRAAGYGLADEQSAAIFVLNTWLLGPDFDQRIPALQQILSARQLSPGTKADALTNFSVTVFHQLEQARAAA